MFEYFKEVILSSVWDNWIFRSVAILTSLGFLIQNLLFKPISYLLFKPISSLVAWVKEWVRLREADKELEKVNKAMVEFVELGYILGQEGRRVVSSIKKEDSLKGFDSDKYQKDPRSLGKFAKDVPTIYLKALENAINSMKRTQINIQIEPRGDSYVLSLLNRVNISKKDRDKFIRKVKRREFYHFFIENPSQPKVKIKFV